MTKSIKTCLLTVAALLGSISAYAHNFEVDGIYYSKTSNSTVSVSYKGEDYTTYSKEYSGTIIIPESVSYNGTSYDVTAIDARAFYECSELSSITIPNSVVTIGKAAFAYCYGLASATIGDGVTTLEDYAFLWCNNMTSLTMGSSVTSIGTEAFYGCQKLPSMTMPNGVTTIGTQAFAYCEALTSVKLPYKLTSMSDGLFQYCYGLTSVTIPSSVASVGSNIFLNCSALSTIKCFATTPPTLNSYSFDYLNKNTTMVYVPESAISTYKGSSWWSQFTNINALDEEEEKDDEVKDEDSEFIFEVIDGVNTLVQYNPKKESITKFDDWTSTNKGENSSFSSNTYTFDVVANAVLTFDWKVSSEANYDKLIITLDGTEILNKSGVLSGSYEKTFAEAGSHTLIAKYTKDYSVNNYDDEASISNMTLTQPGEDQTTVILPESYKGENYVIGEAVFKNNNEIKHITIPNSVTSIGSSAFYGCSGLTSVTIPSSVTSIGEGAFCYCSGLTSVTIPNSVTSIGSGAFDGCSGLTSVHISDIATWCGIEFGTWNSNPLYYAHHLYLNGEEVRDLVIPNSVTSIGGGAFCGCSGLTSVTIPNSVTSIGSSAFYGCSGLTSVTIPNNVTSIGEYTFYECSGLTSVTIPNSVTSIGEYTFYKCSALTSVTIPNTVTSIGEYTFYKCSGLTSVTIPNSVTTIGRAAFFGCSGLTSVTIPNTVTSIGGSTFRDCSGLTSVTIPNSVTSIGDEAFYGCSGLTSVTIPNNVTSIGVGTFRDCSGLTSVTIPNSVTSIGNRAFEGCSGLTSVTIPNSVTSLGGTVFGNCSGLISVSIGNGLTSIGSMVFAWCSSLISVTIPNSVTSLGTGVFAWCTNLTSVTIGNGVTNIDVGAFEDCPLNDVYCLAENVPTTNDGAFNKAQTATLHVPAASLANYKTTSPWSGFGTIKALPQAMTIVDGEVFVNEAEQTLSTLTYTRTLPNLKWNALYVPFEIPVAEIADKYEVAYINNINSYDYDDDGSIDNMSMEIIKIKSGTLNANYPYLIKARNDEARSMNLTLENTTLYPTVSRSIDCSSVYARHEVTGIYDRMYQSELPKGAMAISVNGVWQPIASGSYLNPFRLYMTITVRDGSPVKVEPAAMSRIRISVLGEDEMETGVEEMENGNRKTEKVILDLSGRRVQNPTKGGVYIINGKKMVY